MYARRPRLDIRSFVRSMIVFVDNPSCGRVVLQGCTVNIIDFRVREYTNCGHRPKAEGEEVSD